jgi:uncharacterized protein
MRRRRGVPRTGLFLVFAASIAGGWFLARSTPPERAQSAHQRGPRHVAAEPRPRSFTTLAPEIASTATAPASTAPPPRPVVPSAAPTGVTTMAPRLTTAPPSGAVPRLAIIIDDCGQWPATERALIDLPIPLTLSIMPGAPYALAIQQSAADAGQGIMLHLPMEPRSEIDPGKGEITTAMDDATIEAQVRDDLRHVPLARGVNNHEGSKATADARVMRAVAVVLAEEGRYFVDSRTTAATLAAKETAAADVPTASRNVFLDNVVTVTAIEAQLERAAEIAKQRGFAIAIGHPKPATLAALQAEIPRIEGEGVSFALAQDLVQ